MASLSLFSTPIMYHNFGTLTESVNRMVVQDLETAIKSGKELNEKRTFGAFTSKSPVWQSRPGIEDRIPSFKFLTDILEEKVKELLEISYLKTAEKVAVRRLWINKIFDVGGYSAPHTHGTGETYFTGVYYLNGGECLDTLDYDQHICYENQSNMHEGQGGDLILFDPARIAKSSIIPKNKKSNLYGSPAKIIPKESLLVVFPAWLEHMVTPVTVKETRYSISFAVQQLKKEKINA